jgi:hypothetical protein
MAAQTQRIVVLTSTTTWLSRRAKPSATSTIATTLNTARLEIERESIAARVFGARREVAALLLFAGRMHHRLDSLALLLLLPLRGE